MDCLSVWLCDVEAQVAGFEETVETGFVGESSVLIEIDYVFGFVFDLHDCGRVLFDCKDLNVYDDRRLEFEIAALSLIVIVFMLVGFLFYLCCMMWIVGSAFSDEKITLKEIFDDNFGFD